MAVAPGARRCPAVAGRGSRDRPRARGLGAARHRRLAADPAVSLESLFAVGLLGGYVLLLGVGMLIHQPLREHVLGVVAFVLGHGVQRRVVAAGVISPDTGPNR